MLVRRLVGGLYRLSDSATQTEVRGKRFVGKLVVVRDAVPADCASPAV